MKDVDLEMPSSKNPNLEEVPVDEYWYAYRQHVHMLLAWGYAVSRNKVQAKHDETDITGFIAEAIQDILDAPDSPPWCDEIGIRDDHPIPGGGRTGRKRWRPDLIFESREKKPRPRYYFEAKRLRKRKKQSIEDYLGEDGLQCFLSGRYVHECNEAGMLGYVQCDDISTWVARLQWAIDQDFQDKNELLLLSSQCNSQIIDAFPQEWLSKHNRNTGKNIIIYHLILDYCIISPIGIE